MNFLGFGHFRKASSYLRPYTGLAVPSALATLLFVGVGLLAPWPMKILVDSVLGDAPLPESCVRSCRAAGQVRC